MTRLHIALGLLSAALIAFQIELMQLLSIVQWHHFAYMVISVALLGFGASGTAIAIARRWMLSKYEILVPGMMLASGAAMAVVVPLSLTPFARFDTYLFINQPTQVWPLLVTYFLYFTPFFFGALAIGLIFVRHAGRISKFYFSNLIGSGSGGLLAIILISQIRPELLPSLTAVLPFLSGLLIYPHHRRKERLALTGLSAVIVVFFSVNPPTLLHSQYKNLARVLNIPDAEITLERSSPYGLVQVVSSEALRYAPGLSLTCSSTVPAQHVIFNNGDWYGALTTRSVEDSTHVLDCTTTNLPYVMQPRETALFLNSGAGDYVTHALSQHVDSIVAVDPHRTVISLLRNELASASDSIFFNPSVHAASIEPRTYLAATSKQFDLIMPSAIGTFGGTAGLFALQEQYLLTREAFSEMWHRLTPGGVIAVTVWMDYPYRASLRMLATLVDVTRSNGIQNPIDHLAAVRSWGTITYVLKRSPLSDREIERIKQFCERYAFDPVILPGLDPQIRNQYNVLQDDQFFQLIDKILSPGQRDVYRDYAFELKPATDNRPYFSQFVRWKSIPYVFERFGEQSIPFLEIGYLIAVVTLFQTTLAAVVLILLPLVRIGWQGTGKTWTVLYFGGLGLGFMFVEMVLIQRFMLYLGTPIYATTAVLAILLVFSGFGSLTSSRLPTNRKTLGAVSGVVAVFILIYGIALTPYLHLTIDLPLGLKALSALALIAPPAFVMGMPFPMGLRYLNDRSESHVPWAWGINGALSVVSTALAAILAVEVGFPGVMFLAAAAYGLVALTGFRSR